MTENRSVIPDALKIEFCQTASAFSLELKKRGLLDNPTDFLMGNNRTLSFVSRPNLRPAILICEFNQPPDEPNYARFTSAHNGTTLDIVDPNYQYISPHVIGKISLEHHVRLAVEAIDYLRS